MIGSMAGIGFLVTFFVLITQCVYNINGTGVFLKKTNYYVCNSNKSSAQQRTSCRGPEIKVYGNSLYSLHSMFRYTYNDLHLCEDPDAKLDSPSLSFGQILSGERWVDTPYNMTFQKDSKCTHLCTINYTGEKMEFLKNAVKANYNQNLIFGNVQALICALSNEVCSTSIPVGCYVTKNRTQMDYCITDNYFTQPDTYYLFNHLKFKIQYELVKDKQNMNALEDVGRILSVLVTPTSRKSCERYTMTFGIKGSDTNVTVHYTYSVKFVQKKSVLDRKQYTEKSLKELTSNSQTDVMMFSIVNSVVVMVFLSVSFAGVLGKVFYKDAWLTKKLGAIDLRCKKSVPKLQHFDPNGMKDIYGDVFRTPPCGLLLCSLLGNGTQLFGVAVITLVCACFGLTEPYNGVRGQLLTIMIYSWTALAFVSGLVAARLYKMFSGKLWKDTLKITLTTALIFPGILFGTFLILNIIHTINGSSTAVSLKTLLTEASLWIGISLPLTFLGSVTGNNLKVIENPVPTNPTRRYIPKKSCVNHPLVGFAVGGILPFGCIFIQLFFTLNAIWNVQQYTTYGYMFITFLVLIITVVELSVLQCYFQLQYEDYRWWWRSWLNNASTGLYLFIYAVYFYSTKCLFNGVTSLLIFLGYMAMVAFVITILTGAVAFISCFIFVRKAYSVLEIEIDEEVEDVKNAEEIETDKEQNL